MFYRRRALSTLGRSAFRLDAGEAVVALSTP